MIDSFSVRSPVSRDSRVSPLTAVQPAVSTRAVKLFFQKEPVTEWPTDCPVLEARGVSVGYGSISVVHDLDLVVGRGEVVALLGVNGAGKTTTVRALAGDLKHSAGEILFKGQPTTAPLHERARHGLRLITEERSVFMGLSTADNLRLGGQSQERCLELFPELRRLLGQKAGLLSGGEQQMLTLARAVAGEPDVLLADELSLCLAPMVFERLLGAIRAAADRGTGILLVEQHVRDALEVADRAYVLSHGSVVLTGTANELIGQIEEIERTYLASSELTTA
jgi:branched-chain amino acid transport system ATP-binding protein